MYNWSWRHIASLAGILVGILGTGALPAHADFVTLEDLNSVVIIDPNSLAGVFNWSVEGTNHIAEQTFWVGTGSTGGEFDLSIFSPTFTLMPGTRGLRVTYVQPQFEIVVEYLLSGGVPGSRTSQLHESVRITNTMSTETLSLRLFQETDFDLAGTEEGDIVQFVGPNTWRQERPGRAVAETVVSPGPDRWEAAVFPFTLLHLLDDQPSMLNNSGGPVGPDDVAWASQWNVPLGPGQSFDVDIMKSITEIPEPSAMLLTGTVLAAFVFGRCRRSAQPGGSLRLFPRRQHEHL